MKLKVSLVQHSPVYLNSNECIEKSVRLIEEAANNGADIIAFPETWIPGYPLWLDSAPGAVLWDSKETKEIYKLYYDNSLEYNSNNYNILKGVADKTGVIIIMGISEKYISSLYNSIIYLIPGDDNYYVHRKLIPTYTERLYWSRGDGSTMKVIKSDFGNIGALVCWEHWMPALRAYMHSQKEVLHFALWPSVHERHQIATRQYAFEGGCFTFGVGTNTTKQMLIDSCNTLKNISIESSQSLKSVPDGILLHGGSCGVNPDISLISDPIDNKEIILYFDIETDLVIEQKLTLDTDGHYSRPDIFKISVNNSPQINIENTYNS